MAEEDENGPLRRCSGQASTPDHSPGQAGSGGAEAGEGGIARIHPNKRRRVQAARTGGRKLFDRAAQEVFLEWFAATCNLAWSAEQAGFNYKTVLRHRMNDADFAEGWDRAVRQGYARLEAKRLETKRREAPIGIEGDLDAPEMDDPGPERTDAILLARAKDLAGARKSGRPPTVATNAEVRAALVKRLAAFGVRVDEEGKGEGEAASE